MKRAERVAMVGFFGLLAICVILTTAVVMFGTMSFWAGMLAAYGQTLLVGLTWWGLRLALMAEGVRRSLEIRRLTREENANAGGFSAPEDAGAAVIAPPGENEVRTLETGFQRVVVALSAVSMIGLALWIGYMVYGDVTGVKPGEQIALSPTALNETAIVLTLGVLAIYAGLFQATRVRRGQDPSGEAVHGVFLVALPGAVAMTAAVIAGWYQVHYAAEAGAGVILFLTALQGVELFVNALKSYAGIEEFDQAPVNLQMTPLVPMIASGWIIGLRMLIAQSVGLAGEGRSGVVARVMPRVIVAVLVVVVAASTMRVVPPGNEAIRERLGQVDLQADGRPVTLQPGLHVMLPWPLDQLVLIPTGQVRRVLVGVDDDDARRPFLLWTERHTSGEEINYVTGDGQMLGGFVGVYWRVKDTATFYNGLSHAHFYAEGEEATKPIFEGLVQENAFYAVQRAIGVRALDDVLGPGRGQVEEECRKIMQARLDAIQSGIEIVQLTIKDVHPPAGSQIEGVNGQTGSPAWAYEDVVRAREEREMMINRAEGDRVSQENNANGEAEAIKSRANGERDARINQAIGDNAYMAAMSEGLGKHQDLARWRLLFNTMSEVLPTINKIVLGKDVVPPHIIQGDKSTNNPPVNAVAPGPGP